MSNLVCSMCSADRAVTVEVSGGERPLPSVRPLYLSSWKGLLFAILILALSPSQCLAAKSITVTVLPEAGFPETSSRQLVRLSVPLPRGFLRKGQTLKARIGNGEVRPGVRPLTWYASAPAGPEFVRQALVTFPYDLPEKPFEIELTAAPGAAAIAPNLPATVTPSAAGVDLVYRDGTAVHAAVIAPAVGSPEVRTEVVESNEHYLWLRLHVDDPTFPRVIEVRADAIGQVALVLHLQNRGAAFGRAPDLGWEITTRAGAATFQWERGKSDLRLETSALIDSGNFPTHVEWGQTGEPPKYQVYHVSRQMNQRGSASAFLKDEKLTYRYLRARSLENAPMQQAAWRRAEVVVAPMRVWWLTDGLRPMLKYRFDSKVTADHYAIPFYPFSQFPRDLQLWQLLESHHLYGIGSSAGGDDAGNVTGFNGLDQKAPAFGMNRLNHALPMLFEESAIKNRFTEQLAERALLWCDNFYDLTIWWGPGETGGTRYNNLAAMGQTPPPSDPPFMWRSNSAVSFCTKGFDSFFIAYEQTGDPRYLEALNAQVDYASKHMTSGENYTRNVGCVRDFVNLYKWTGERKYLDQALRLFRETRAVLSTGDLFTEGGKPIEADLPFIELDAQGYQHPFAKPYILGYALEGLPELLKLCPKEPKLKEVVQAVADFMVASQDPVGGWRYPHPRSSYVIMSQAMEHAWQIMNADRVLPRTGRLTTDGGRQTTDGGRPAPGGAGFDPTTHEGRLDAIERVLRQRIQGWLKTGKIWSGITGWEIATGKVKKQDEIPALYGRPADRDFKRDYTEGRPDFGSSPPEGIVYFPEVLRYYLKFRPASRLLAPPKPGDPLDLLLKRAPAASK